MDIDRSPGERGGLRKPRGLTKKDVIYMTRRPKACFLPVTMKLFWRLYPQLEQQTLTAMEIVKAQLGQRFEILDCGLVGDAEEAGAGARKNPV